MTEVDAASQLPGGGRRLFPDRLVVALYGHPGAPELGALGEQDADATIARAHRAAASFLPLTRRRVLPALEIIASVATLDPQADGSHTAPMPAEALLPLVLAAGAAGTYVVLDLQPGRNDFLSQARLYESLLVLPHVGLGLDPEWRLAPHQVPLVQVGSVTADEVNGVVDWLAHLTARHGLPQKLLVLYQFELAMITNRHLLDTTRPEIALLIHIDAHGSPDAKLQTGREVLAGAPPGALAGWKNFPALDTPSLTPRQTMELVVPSPDLVTYQ